MAEVFVEFDVVIIGPDGVGWVPRACGREDASGLWEGWIEFVPDGSAEPVRTQRETIQPNRVDLMYWSQGLTRVYLESALLRALSPVRVHPREVRDTPPVFDGPASHAVLNPFDVYRQ